MENENLDFDANLTCPICHEDIIFPGGSKKSQILLINDHPSPEEIRLGKPMVGNIGTIMMNEFGFLGIDLKMLRHTTLWLHEPNKNKDCLAYSAGEAIKEAKNKKLILLIGTDTTKYFCGRSAIDVCGLQVKSHLLTKPILFAMVSPREMFGGTVGEVRLALKKFVRLIEEMKLL